MRRHKNETFRLVRKSKDVYIKLTYHGRVSYVIRLLYPRPVALRRHCQSSVSENGPTSYYRSCEKRAATEKSDVNNTRTVEQAQKVRLSGSAVG